MILVMSKSLAQGTRAGLATAAGVSAGLVGHTLLATLGLGALLRTSEWLFTGIKFAGAAYLVYLGVQLLRTRKAHRGGVEHQQSQDRGLLLRFPAAVRHARCQGPTLTIFALGLVFAVLTFVIKGPVAIFAGRLSSWFRTRPAALLDLYRLSGLVMIGLAVRLALTRRD